MDRNAPTLETLCASLERAWRERRDHTAVDKLADQYPDLAPYLYAFLSGLLAEELGAGLPEELMRESARRTSALLEDVGIPAIEARAPRRGTGAEGNTHGDAAPPGANHPAAPGRASSRPVNDREREVSLFSFLRQRTGLPPTDIAKALRASVQFLMGLGRVRRLPIRVIEALQDLIAAQFAIAPAETLPVIRRGLGSSAFATSAGPAGGHPIEYVTLVRTAKLAPADETYWASLADDGAESEDDAQAGAA